MTDLRDPRLRKALDHAPDSHLAPAPWARDAIKNAAREAVVAPGRPAAAALAPQPWWRRFLPEPGGSRMPWNAAFATVLVAGFVTLLWQGQPVPDARLDEPAPASAPAQPPPQQQPQQAPTASPGGASPPPAPAAEAARERKPAATAAKKEAAAGANAERRAADAQAGSKAASAQADAPSQRPEAPEPPAPAAMPAPVAPTARAAAAPSIAAQSAAAPPPGASAREEAAAAPTAPAPVMRDATRSAQGPAQFSSRLGSSAAVREAPALDGWTGLRIARAGMTGYVAREEGAALMALLRAVAPRTGPSEPFPGPGTARIEIVQGEELLAVLELGGENWVRWSQLRPGVAGRWVAQADAEALRALLAELRRLGV